MSKVQIFRYLTLIFCLTMSPILLLGGFIMGAAAWQPGVQDIARLYLLCLGFLLMTIAVWVVVTLAL